MLERRRPAPGRPDRTRTCADQLVGAIPPPRANLTGANLSGAKLEGAILSEIQCPGRGGDKLRRVNLTERAPEPIGTDLSERRPELDANLEARLPDRRGA